MKAAVLRNDAQVRLPKRMPHTNICPRSCFRTTCQTSSLWTTCRRACWPKRALQQHLPACARDVQASQTCAGGCCAGGCGAAVARSRENCMLIFFGLCYATRLSRL
eukprot:3262983-Rhodomonas_salina.2